MQILKLLCKDIAGRNMGIPHLTRVVVAAAHRVAHPSRQAILLRDLMQHLNARDILPACAKVGKPREALRHNRLCANAALSRRYADAESVADTVDGVLVAQSQAQRGIRPARHRTIHKACIRLYIARRKPIVELLLAAVRALVVGERQIELMSAALPAPRIVLCPGLPARSLAKVVEIVLRDTELLFCCALIAHSITLPRCGLLLIVLRIRHVGRCLREIRRAVRKILLIARNGLARIALRILRRLTCRRQLGEIVLDRIQLGLCGVYLGGSSVNHFRLGFSRRRLCRCRACKSGIDHDLCVDNPVLLVADLVQHTRHHRRAILSSGTAWCSTSADRLYRTVILCIHGSYVRTLRIDRRRIVRLRLLRRDRLLRALCAQCLCCCKGVLHGSKLHLCIVQIRLCLREIRRGISHAGLSIGEVLLRISEILLRLRESLLCRAIGGDLILDIHHVRVVTVHIVQRIVAARESLMPRHGKKERTRCRSSAPQEITAALRPSQHTHAFSILSRSGSLSPYSRWAIVQKIPASA